MEKHPFPPKTLEKTGIRPEPAPATPPRGLLGLHLCLRRALLSCFAQALHHLHGADLLAGGFLVWNLCRMILTIYYN